jgi:hypothetical protein
MRLLQKAMLSAAVLAIAATGWPEHARALLPEIAIGSAVHGAKKTSSELVASAERIVRQLDILRRETNTDVTNRLEQVRSILKDADVVIENAIDAMRELEMQVNEDAIRLLYRARCTVAAAQMDFQIQFANYIASLSDAKPGIKFLGITIFSWGTEKEIKITHPNDAYYAIKRATLQRLENLTDGAPAYEIYSAYQNLIRGAELARCHYLGEDLGRDFGKEVNDLQRLSRPWSELLSPAPPTRQPKKAEFRICSLLGLIGVPVCR